MHLALLVDGNNLWLSRPVELAGRAVANGRAEDYVSCDA